jgi:ribokinase
MSVLVFGSINADFIVGVDHLPKPGETVVAPTYRFLPGGKGANQAVAAARAGARVAFHGRIGEDAFGQALKDGLAAEGIDVTGLLKSKEPTGAAFIAIDTSGENQILGALGANYEARAADVPDASLGPATTVVLEMEVPPVENAALAARARKAGSRVIFNFAPAMRAPASLFTDVSILVLNEHEAASLAKQMEMPEREPKPAAAALARRFGNTVIVTLGAEGAIAIGPDAAWRIGALDVTVVDTVGAGDAFLGTLAAALDQGRDLPSALRRASVAGALACTVAGARDGLPTRAVVDRREADLAAATRF